MKIKNCFLAAMVSALNIAAFPSEAADFSQHKTAVVYYTLLHNRDFAANDSQKDKAKGNTQIVAENISADTGAEIFELLTVEKYPATYRQSTSLAQDEIARGYKPELLNTPDISGYDIIFIGYPTWWSTYPPAVATFLSSQDFSGKTIIPFCTHGGSAFGHSIRDLQNALPSAKVIQNGFEISGNDVEDEDTPEEIKAFLQELNLE